MKILVVGNFEEDDSKIEIYEFFAEKLEKNPDVSVIFGSLVAGSSHFDCFSHYDIEDMPENLVILDDNVYPRYVNNLAPDVICYLPDELDHFIAEESFEEICEEFFKLDNTGTRTFKYIYKSKQYGIQFYGVEDECSKIKGIPYTSKKFEELIVTSNLKKEVSTNTTTGYNRRLFLLV